MSAPDQTQYVAAIGALYNVPLVVVGVAFTAVAWFNGAELLLTIFTTFKKPSTYFYSLIIASLGVLCFQSAVFCMIFAPKSNGYGIIASVDVGWTCMVTGQSMVLWSRLHLVCHSRWKLRAILYMIIANCILCHGTQTVCSLLAVQNNAINPEYPPFVYTEKVSLCLFFTQEVIISSVYIWETVKVLRIAQAVKDGGKYRRMRDLFVANIAILLLDVALITLEFAALWGVWCTFKGFAYSIKLKIEFAILNQLRDTLVNPNAYNSNNNIHANSSANSAQRRQYQKASESGHGDVQLSAYGNQANCFHNGPLRRASVADHITKTTEYTISHLGENGHKPTTITGAKHRTGSESPSESEIHFASKGA